MKKLLRNKGLSLTYVLNQSIKNKLSLLILFITFSSFQAKVSPQQLITLDLENVSVSFLIDKIESSTRYRFAYKTTDVDLNRTLSIKATNQEMSKVLQQVFDGTTTGFKVIGDQVLLSSKGALKTKFDLNEDQSVVTGMVIDEFGNPFIGVYVVIKGTNSGVMTDFDGRYTISVNPSDTLLFSHVGYKTVVIEVGIQSTIDVQMEESLAELSEVVVTGFFERKEESYTGATVTVTSEDLRKVGSQNVFQAIQNIDPSISLMDNFDLGSNPNNLPDLQIRGTSTFPGSTADDNLKGNYLRNPNQPLFILNGFEASAERVFDLDFNRVERITILKDAASKALYGSRAANGVVVIETKQLSGEDALVTYTANLDVELPDLTSYNLTNSFQKLEAELIDGLYTPSLANPDRLVELQQLYQSRLKLANEGLNTDWMAKPLQNGIGHRHSLGVELGNKDLRLQANLNYRKSVGVMKGSSRENIGGNLTAFYRVKNLNFKNSTTINNNVGEESPYGTFNEYAIMNPYWRAKNPDGSIPYYAEIGPNGERYTNPLYNSLLDSKNTSTYLNFVNNFYLEWNILPALKTIARVGIDLKKSKADEFYPSEHTRFENYALIDKNRKGSYQVNNGQSSYLYGDLNLQYSKSFRKHLLFGNAGFNVSEREFEEVIHLAEGFPSSRMDDIVFARSYALDSRPTGISGVSRDVGFLFVGSYIYDNRFLSDFTFRTSASSQFGDDKRWSNFWSVGLGWNLHNEKFFAKAPFEQFRIRASVGSTGNQNFNSNESVVTYGYYLDSRYQDNVGSYALNMGNPGLQWETKFDFNNGFDIKIGGLTLRYDYYESYTENLITDITLPYYSGFSSVKDNLGKVKNSGIEANISYLLWSRGRNYFSINGGITTNENKIIELSDALQSFNDAQDKIAADRGNNRPVNRYESGMSMNAIWAVPSLGIDPSTGQEIYVKQDGSTTYEWDADDLVVVGNSNPKYRGIFGFSGEYEGFGISVTARYLGGGQLYNQTLVDKVENVDMNYNVDERVLTGRWRYPGQHALYKRLGTYSVDPDGDNVFVSLQEKTRPTSRFVQDRNELDIAAINVYYEFKPRLTKAMGLDRLRLSFNMNDVAKFSSIEIERGTQYPFSRSMTFSLMANL